jgi:hypothetical protein
MIYDLNADLAPTDDDAALTLRIRAIRDRLLAESDWTQLPDAPVDATAWAEYRQELRDSPSTWTPGPTWNAPTPPPAKDA